MLVLSLPLVLGPDEVASRLSHTARGATVFLSDDSKRLLAATCQKVTKRDLFSSNTPFEKRLVATSHRTESCAEILFVLRLLRQAFCCPA